MKKTNLKTKIGYMIFVLLVFCLVPVPAAPCGDVNSNMEIDIVDALLIAQYYVGLNPSNFDSTVADVNCDGQIDIIDALLIAQLYVDLISQLECCDTPTPTPPPNVNNIPGIIEAEDYDDMSGIETETTSDTGGGSNVGWIDAGDWMDYDVHVTTTGAYTVEYRVASESSGGEFQLRNGSTTLHTVSFGATGGWQTWITVSSGMNLNAGYQTLRIYASQGGWNINWIRFSSGTPDPTPVPTPSPTPVQGNGFVGEHGQLRVSGNRIVDQYGNGIILRGMSLSWTVWWPQFYNYSCVQWLRDDFRCTVVRASMAVSTNDGGYLTNRGEANYIRTVVEAAIDLGIYVVIDFHAHEKYQSEAQEFFSDMARSYGDYPNVIYETWNEPLDEDWNSSLKPYHEAVISSIRNHDPDNIVLCGTRQWSQRPDEASSNPINDPNVAYVFHFYAATHTQWLRDNCTTALNRGVALFCSEYGVSEASGNGRLDYNEQQVWWDFMDQNGISSCNWSICDKNESSAALRPGASASGGWSTDQLSDSGRFVRDYLRSILLYMKILFF